MATETVPESGLRESIQSAFAEQSGTDSAERPGSEAPSKPADGTQAAQTQQPQDTAKAPGAAADSAGSDESLPGVDYATLTPEQRRQVNKILTPKFQEYSAAQKRLEKLSEYEPLIEAFNSDPERVLQALAKEQGFTLSKAEAAAAAATVESGGSKAMGVLAELFGPEAAAQLAPVVQELVKEGVQKEVGPIKQTMDQQRQEAIKESSDRDLKVFGERHPDWKQHEKAMTDLAKRLNPGKDQSAQDYLDELYGNVTMANRLAAKQAEDKKADIARQTRSAAAAESLDGGVAGSKVSNIPGSHPDERESIAMAMRGETVPQ